jgi:hypothetical protein
MRYTPAILLAGTSFFAASLSAVAAETATPQQKACFYSNQLESWRAADAKTLYIRVALARHYRLDLSAACPAAQRLDAHLITTARGSNLICKAIDWDIQASDSSGGFAQPCIVKSMTPLSADEVAAIPKGAKP